MHLFLDFDGVLHPVRSLTEPKFCRMPLLESWLRLRPRVCVVISSSWKEVHPFDEMRGYFSQDLRVRVLGCTPDYDAVPGRSSSDQPDTERDGPRFRREAECRRWLADAGAGGKPWAVLDDMPELFTPGLRELVVCDPTTGLAPEQLVALDRLLA